jgi:hypothetical protein
VRQLKHVVEAIAHSQDWSPTNVRREIAKAHLHNVDTPRRAPAEIGTLDDTAQRILKALDGTKGIARKALQEKLADLSAEMVKYHLKKLVISQHVTRLGGGRNSKYKRV